LEELSGVKFGEEAEGIDDCDHSIDGGDRFEAAQSGSLHEVSFFL
jgi:hypothetical protein